MTGAAVPRRNGGVAFLLAQLGAHATEQFAERISALDLLPVQAGILRAVAGDQGRSQQALSEQLGLLPSRVVAFIDDLESRGLIERRRNTQDRRLHALHLTAEGEHLMRRLADIGRAHERAVAAGLSAAERAELGRLLERIAERQGLTPGVHPGFRSAGRAEEPRGSAGT